MEPAASLIRKLGGPEAVSTHLGVAFTAPYRWTHTPEKGGTGGIIPRKYHAALVELATERGVQLSPADFVTIPQPEGTANDFVAPPAPSAEEATP